MNGSNEPTGKEKQPAPKNFTPRRTRGREQKKKKDGRLPENSSKSEGILRSRRKKPRRVLPTETKSRDSGDVCLQDLAPIRPIRETTQDRRWAFVADELHGSVGHQKVSAAAMPAAEATLVAAVDRP